MKRGHTSRHASICISVALLLTSTASANGFSEMKVGANTDLPCHEVNFETSSQDFAKQLLEAAIPRINALTEDEEERSALKEGFLSYGPGALNQFVLEGFFREPLECVPMECRGAVKLVIFKHYLKSQTDGILRDFATEWKGGKQGSASASDDDRDKARDEEIQVMQKVEVGLGEVLSPERLVRFNECLQQTFMQDAVVSTRALLRHDDTDKILTEDEVRTISEVVGKVQSDFWWKRVSCPAINVSELRRDARRDATSELEGKVSDKGLALAKKVLWLSGEGEPENKKPGETPGDRPPDKRK